MGDPELQAQGPHGVVDIREAVAQVEEVGGPVGGGDDAGVGGDRELLEAQLGHRRGPVAADRDQAVAPDARDRSGLGLRILGVAVAPGEQAVHRVDVGPPPLAHPGLLGSEQRCRIEVGDFGHTVMIRAHVFDGQWQAVPVDDGWAWPDGLVDR